MLFFSIYLVVLGIAFIKKSHWVDGKYWGKWIYEYSLMDHKIPFKKRLYALNSISELSKLSNKSILLNGAIISGSMSTFIKSNAGGEYSNGSDEYRFLFKIEYLGEKCIGEYDYTIEFGYSEEDVQIEENIPLLILGVVFRDRIKVKSFEKAMEKDKIYDKNYFPPQ